MTLPSSLAEAKRIGAQHYFTGLTCINGHVEKRHTNNSHCLACDRDRQVMRLQDPAYRALHNKLTLKSRLKQLADPVRRKEIREQEKRAHMNSDSRREKKAKAAKLWAQQPRVVEARRDSEKTKYHDVLKHDPAYKQASKKRGAQWVRNNRSKVNAKTAARRAARLRATPPWLTVAMHDEIASFYDLALLLSLATDVPHEVDHVVPLNGKKVSGLHVPWNLQVLTEEENRSKFNHFKE